MKTAYIVLMPIFEYRCTVCAHEFEAYVRSQDPPPSHCPQCRAEHIEKMLSV